ncbi:MAG: hypothetical protein RIR90_786, partial [Bacteroidota bacterium]
LWRIDISAQTKLNNLNISYLLALKRSKDLIVLDGRRRCFQIRPTNILSQFTNNAWLFDQKKCICFMDIGRIELRVDADRQKDKSYGQQLLHQRWLSYKDDANSCAKSSNDGSRAPINKITAGACK